MINDAQEVYRYTNKIPAGYRAEMVFVNPMSSKEERETSILMNDGEDDAEVSSAQKVVIRYLLQHPSFRIDQITWFKGMIVGVSGKMPRTCVLISSKPRQIFSGGFRRRGRK